MFSVEVEVEVEVLAVWEEGGELGVAEGDEGDEEGVDAAVTVYLQSGDTLTGFPHATRTVTVPLAGTVYVFEAVLS